MIKLLRKWLGIDELEKVSRTEVNFILRDMLSIRESLNKSLGLIQDLMEVVRENRASCLNLERDHSNKHGEVK
jgi:hypothetical protein